MKRYLLFAGTKYYPCGGAEDFLDRFETLQDAIERGRAHCEEESFGWWNVFDLEQNKIVAHGAMDYHKRNGNYTETVEEG